MSISLASIPRVPALALIGATAVSGAALAALTPSIMPRTSSDRKLLAIGGGVLGAAAGGAIVGALALTGKVTGRFGPAAVANAIGPVRTALTAATLLGAGAAVATHWSPGVVTTAPDPVYDPGDKPVIRSAEEQAAQPAKPGTSQVGRDVINRSGLRFLDTIMTGLKSTPARVYTSLANGATPEERIQFTIDRMHETGAFDKSRIVVAQPTGTGYVDQMPIQTAEILAKGDIATVAVQYGDKPSLSPQSMLGREDAANQYRALLTAINAEIEKLPEGKRPNVYVYGYSLGSWGTQDAITRTPSDFDDLGVKRALWIGTPGPSHWYERVPEDAAKRVTGLDNLQSLTAKDLPDSVRVLAFDNTNDPIAKLDLSGIWKKPDWMKRDDSPSNGVWVPGISYLQTLVDSKYAIEESRDGVWADNGHQYRMGDVKAVNLAFDLPEVSDERLRKIHDRTERLEQKYFATHQ